MNSKSNSIWWWEPRWSFVPRNLQGMAGLLKLKPWLWILAVSAVIFLLLAIVFRRVVPDLEFNWFLAFFQAIVAGVGGLGFIIGWTLLIPPMVSVSRNGISRQQGEGAHWRKRADIRRISIVLTDPAKPLLRVETKGNPYEAGIASKVSPTELVAFLKSTFPELLVEEIR